MEDRRALVIVGAGAAGLMAAIAYGRARGASAAGGGALVLEGAPRVGAKILVSGGGRCNVTHRAMDPEDLWGASPKAIGKVLKRFGPDRTVAFFAELGVGLKEEETGKLFPVSDSARTVLGALLRAARDAGAEIRPGCRVERLLAVPGGYRLEGPFGAVEATRVLLATGGKSLPKSGSDGGGYGLATGLGHTLTPRILPALVPLALPPGDAFAALAGITVPVRLTVRAGSGKRLFARDGALLFTHKGLSGPAVLDVSRHLSHARLDDPGTVLGADFLPDEPAEALDRRLAEAGARTLGRLGSPPLPARLAEALVARAGLDPARPAHTLRREERRALAAVLKDCPLPVIGDLGFGPAEVTAGGVPLSEVHLDRMESRPSPGLYLAGELLDVDGPIGGYNFQWAWASGYVAGTGAARADAPGAAPAAAPA